MNLKYRTVLLRAIEEEDMKICQQMINDSDIEYSTVGKSLPVSSQQQMEWFQQGERQTEIRLIAEIQPNEIIGMVILSNINWINRSAEVGLKLMNTPNRNTQNTYDIAACIIKYVFDELNLNCLYANTLKENYLSRKLLKESGFSEEGIMRERVFKHGKYYDVVCYSLLYREYIKQLHQ